MARFFIDRPIFAWVIALVIMLAGILAIRGLPVAQYPNIAPPAISINASYPGASAKTVEDSVTQVIEQKMKGIDGLLYMSSTSDSSGNVSLLLTFKAGTDPDIAQVQVQNKLSLATPLLPEEVQRQGVQVAKSARNFLMVIGFVSEDGSMDNVDIGDYISANVVDIMSRVEGVGEVQVFGSQYAMRIWVDPAKLQNFKITTNDVVSAIRAQNAQVSAGQLGGMPAVVGQEINATVTAQSRLQTAEEFRNIILRTNGDGSSVYIKDVATVELGNENYGIIARFNGKPAGGMGVKLASGANALDTAEALKKQLKELEPYFPPGLKTVVPYDTTPFVQLSIKKVVNTLIEAVVLVFLVMFLFLQNWRATLIPTIAVPVVLLGTFAVLSALGYSINTLTMFAMVLAIGLLVDDAIVVVENVERVIHEEHLSPKEATRKSMDEITGALVGIAMVLSAVFIPMAFFGGSTGVIYRQFSVTLVTAMALSVMVAIVLTPALCATILKDSSHKQTGDNMLGRFFTWFNRMFDGSNVKTQQVATSMIKNRKKTFLVYFAVIGLMAFLMLRLPSAFLPDEDQGLIFTQIITPTGATTERTLETVKQVENHFMQNEADSVRSIFTVTGFSFAGQGQNMALGFVATHHWDDRPDDSQHVNAIAGRAMGAFSQLRDAMAFAFVPPAVTELGTSTGFNFHLQDRAGLGHEKLLEARNMLLGMASQDSRLMGVRPNGQEDTPQLKVNVDLAKAGALGVSQSEINSTLSTAWGSTYVNDFVDRGRVKRVYVQGIAESRMNPEDINKWFVRNNNGEMVPFSSFATTEWTYGSPRLERYNGFSSMEIQGMAGQGFSTGDAMAAIEEIVAKLPAGVGIEWTGMSYEERQTGGQAPLLYALSLLIVFLCLAALYESWAIPASVMLVVPMGIVGAVIFATIFGNANDVYFQVALLTTIGLASKNAILIVEFAKDRMENRGMTATDAAIEAVRLRLRPIIMTSLAFIFGVLPLAIASSAGSGAQNALGLGVIGGMLTSAFFAILFVPLLFTTIRMLFPPKPKED